MSKYLFIATENNFSLKTFIWLMYGEKKIKKTNVIGDTSRLFCILGKLQTCNILFQQSYYEYKFFVLHEFSVWEPKQNDYIFCLFEYKTGICYCLLLSEKLEVIWAKWNHKCNSETSICEGRIHLVSGIVIPDFRNYIKASYDH